MWKKKCDTAARCMAEAKEYKKKRYEKTHKQPDFKEGYPVLVYTMNVNNLNGPKNMGDLFLGPFRIITLIGKNVMQVQLQEEFSRKHPVFTVSIVKPYHQTGEVKFPIESREIRLIGKDNRQYTIRFKNQTGDKDKWLAEDAIPDGVLHLRRFRASSRAQESDQL
ncbi:hypothetical protein O181_067578 [Austropuccinia psidii MF-1]|uniref:Tf2-1-like SH3-like domain-containing protein n=1 Tax=Austropuccinia psidii MF-1 TaxID=1389203 RepID=A0A9Q3EZ13_9BASI|nr:hypothetical protein [Austropuccinia psidii MF-1]